MPRARRFILTVLYHNHGELSETKESVVITSEDCPSEQQVRSKFLERFRDQPEMVGRMLITLVEQVDEDGRAIVWG